MHEHIVLLRGARECNCFEETEECLVWTQTGFCALPMEWQEEGDGDDHGCQRMKLQEWTYHPQVVVLKASLKFVAICPVETGNCHLVVPYSGTRHTGAWRLQVGSQIGMSGAWSMQHTNDSMT